ncbi:hypothetical protein ACI1US_01987 [Leucobacter sp. BZR 635]
MTNPTDQTVQSHAKSTKALDLKPAEIFGFSGVLAIFAALIVLMSSRSFMLTIIFAAIAFVVSLAFIGLISLGGKKQSDTEGEAL